MFNKTSKLLSTALITAMLLIPFQSTAAIITYNNYSLDTDTNVVTGGGVDWLRWDVTRGYSIEDALAEFSSEGWEVATGDYMATLFNSFMPERPWIDDENEIQFLDTGYSLEYSDLAEGDVQLIELFGFTRSSFIEYLNIDPLLQAQVLFGKDLDGDGRYNLASVYDDATTVLDGHLAGDAFLLNDIYTIDQRNARIGVALVRGDLTVVDPVDPVNPVDPVDPVDPVNPPVHINEPPANGLLAAGLGLIGLMRLRRNKD